MDSPQQHRRGVSRLNKLGSDGGADDPSDKKTKEQPQRERADPQRVKRAVPSAGEKEQCQQQARKSSTNSRQYELKLGEVVTTVPTIDLNAGTVEYKNLSFIVQKDTEMIH